MRYTALALASALLLTSPVAAYAVANKGGEGHTPVTVTRTVTWFGYYTPGDKQSTNSWNGRAHAYPQFLLKSNLSLSCGQRYITQTDVMVGTESELDSITADGKLTAGEDSHVTKSWTVTFHEEPACPTSTPTTTPTETPSTPPVGPPAQPTTSASPSSTGTTEPSSSPSSTPSASGSPTPSTASTVAPTTSTPSPSAPSTPSPVTTTSASKPAFSPTPAPSSPAQPVAATLPYTGASETVVLITLAFLCVAAGVLLKLISKKD